MSDLTDEQRIQLDQLHQARKQAMLDLSKNPNSDELNKQYLLGQLQDIQGEIQTILRGS